MNQANLSGFDDSQPKLSRVLFFMAAGAILAIFSQNVLVGGDRFLFVVAGIVILLLGFAVTQYFEWKQQSIVGIYSQLAVDAVLVGVMVGLLGVSLGGLLVLGMFFAYIFSNAVLRRYSGFVLLCFVMSIATYILLSDDFFVEKQAVEVLFATLVSMSYAFYILRSKLVVKRAMRHKIKELEYKYARQLDISSKLAKYMPTQLAQLISAGRIVAANNRRRRVTVFFSDIIGFTELSEKLDSEDLSSFLNVYMEEMGIIAKQFGGTIDKFVGDAMMVFFGDPETSGIENDALRCVEMAITMRRKISLLQIEWQNLGFDGLSVRMGINSGYAHVGNFGHTSHLSYTAIGSEVNLAARLQNECSPDEILISSTTYDLVSHRISCSPKPPVVLKGFDEPVDSWQVIDTIDNVRGVKRPWFEANNPNFFIQVNMAKMTPKDQKEALEAMEEGIRLLTINIKHPSRLR